MSKELQMFNAMAEQVADMVLEKIEFRLKVLLNDHSKDILFCVSQQQVQIDDLLQIAGEIVTSSGELRRKLKSQAPAPTLLPSKNRSKAVMVG